MLNCSLICAGLSLLLLLVYILLGFDIYEDAFITLRYAQNLHQGCGLRFNCDAGAVEGYSNFLWLLLLRGSLWLSSDIMVNARVLGLLLSWSVLILTYLSARRMSPRFAWLPAALLATNLGFVYHAQSGLETPLVSLLLILLYLVERNMVRGRTLSPIALVKGGFIAALLPLARPEALVVPLFLGVRRIVAVVGKRLSVRGLLLWTGTVVLILVPYTLWRVIYFGSLLPTPYFAKLQRGGDLADRLVSGMVYLLTYVRDTPFVLVLLVGFVLILLHASLRPALRDPYLAGLPWILGALMSAIIFSGGDSPGFFYHRFVVHFLPLLYLLLLWCCRAVGNRIERGGVRLGLLLLVLSVTQLGRDEWTHHNRPFEPGQYGANPLFRVIADRYGDLDQPGVLAEWTRATLTGYQHQGSPFAFVGRCVRRHTPPSWTVASFSAGELAFFSGRRFVDMNGLTDPAFSMGVVPTPFEDYLRRRARPELVVVEDIPAPLASVIREEEYSLIGILLNARLEVPAFFRWPGPDMHLLIFSRMAGPSDPSEETVEVEVNGQRYRVARRNVRHARELVSDRACRQLLRVR